MSTTAPDAGAALHHPWTDPPGPGEWVEVAPGVRWLRMPLPFALDHINVWLLEDGDGWTLVDTGAHTRETVAIWERLLADLPGRDGLRHVVATHFHPDHLGMAGWLVRRTGARFSMTRIEWLTASLVYHDEANRLGEQQAAMYREHGLDARRAGDTTARGNRYRQVMSPPPEGHHRLEHGDALAIGAREWAVIVGRGHSPEHACLHSRDLGVLISGDQVLPRITPIIGLWASEPHGDPLEQYLSSFHAFADLPADLLVLPSHRLPFHGLHRRITAIERHHEARLDVLRRACAERPSSAAELLPVMFKRELSGDNIYFAMGEALAHLVYLEHRGELAREQSGGPVRFRTVG